MSVCTIAIVEVWWRLESRSTIHRPNVLWHVLLSLSNVKEKECLTELHRELRGLIIASDPAVINEVLVFGVAQFRMINLVMDKFRV